MENQIEKRKFNKKHLVMILPILFLSLIVLVSAVTIYLNTVHATIQVDEALVPVTTPITISPAYPGETRAATISIENKATVPLNVQLSWNETSNVNGVTYITDMTRTVQVANQSIENVSVSFTFAPDTTAGSVSGDVILSRTA